jgi:8-oxo-dGTP pyrophosphatase MutT (NUDIX family)
MHRQPLLDLLDSYPRRHPGEDGLVRRFREFVTAHPDCFERSLAVGHITGSAWILDTAGERVLLTHHRKLDRWLQPGGHADGDADVLAVARREGHEETGLETLRVADPDIFDLDIHLIPARGAEPAHFHYDVRFLLQDTGPGTFIVSEESHDLAWVPLDDLHRYTDEESMHRMREKCLARRATWPERA